MYLCHLTKGFFCQINTLTNLYKSATAQIEYLVRWGAIRNLAAPVASLTLNDMLNKKNLFNVNYHIKGTTKFLCSLCFV